MTNLARFFNGSETTFGVFYPRHYLVAVFENPKAASSAVRKLYIAGFSQSAAIAVDGRAVLELEKEETGLAAFVMEALSRFFATEQVFTEHDLCHARHGAGFVAVHCTTDEVKTEAWNVLQAESPLDARYYAISGIEHLAGDLRTI